MSVAYRTERLTREGWGLSLEQAILATLAYADVFDYPLTADEIHWYLWGVRAGRGQVYEALSSTGPLAEATSTVLEEVKYYTLPGREALVKVRQRRELASARLWEQAQEYAGWIARMPFVRMVALTGSLAAGNAEDGADIDFLVVTEPGRLWLCRAGILGVVYWAARRGVKLCPNYLITTNALALRDCSPYAARELVQMAPLFGMDTYYQMRAANTWVEAYLPNAWGFSGAARSALLSRSTNRALGKPTLVKRLAEWALRTSPGGWLEGWEMRRKLARFNQQRTAHPESEFGPDWCKGHFDDHERHTNEAFTRRLAGLGLERLAVQDFLPAPFFWGRPAVK
jgi:hypothetical protein